MRGANKGLKMVPLATTVGFLPCCVIAHTPPLVSGATNGITPSTKMNVLDPFCLQREQSRGSSYDAGKMDQT